MERRWRERAAVSLIAPLSTYSASLDAIGPPKGELSRMCSFQSRFAHRYTASLTWKGAATGLGQMVKCGEGSGDPAGN